MIVRNNIRLREINRKNVPIGEAPAIDVVSHDIHDSLVVFEFGPLDPSTNSVTVAAIDLRKAIENATNA